MQTVFVVTFHTDTGTPHVLGAFISGSDAVEHATRYVQQRWVSINSWHWQMSCYSDAGRLVSEARVRIHRTDLIKPTITE
jgi:hypothetical protein